MSDTLVNLRDIKFILYEMLDAEQLTKLEYFEDHSKETFDIALDAAYKLAREVCWPAYTEMDKAGVTLDPESKTTKVPECMHRIYEASKEGGWLGQSASAEFGGQQYPSVVTAACNHMFNAANTAANMYIVTPGGAAGLINSFGSDEQKEMYCEKLYSGEWGGTMCLTEPQAGSSLSDVKTTATKAEDGDHYMISGTKCFISSGDHDLAPNIIHPVLAKIPGSPPGVKGISLFLVPKYRVNEDGSVGEFNDVETAGIEHKLGIKGNATATLSFGENGNCRGWLIGEANAGLKYMFQLMNHARIATGMQATSVATNGYQHALQYSKERLQGRALTEKDPTTPQVPIIKHADVKRMLLVQKSTTESNLAILLYCSYLHDKAHHHSDKTQREESDKVLSLLTPICKAHGSDSAYNSIVQSIQCYGGYGFSEEFPLAQMIRDTKVFPIYEGTNCIQSMDLLGYKTLRDQTAFNLLMKEIGSAVEAASAFEELKELADKTHAATKEIVDTIAHLAGLAMSGKIEQCMSFAVPYLRAFSPMVMSWLLLWQATIALKALKNGANKADQNYYNGKVACARFYINSELPQLYAQTSFIKSNDNTSVEFDEEWF